MEDEQNARVREAQSALKQLGLPTPQQNVRTALVLLSMLGLDAEGPWIAARQQTLGITESMNWMATHYPWVKKGRKDPVRYAPNSRESVRKNSVHQLTAAGILEANSDAPDRAVNSGVYSYRPTEIALAALRTFGTPDWPAARARFEQELGSLRTRWAAERERHRVPVRLPDESKVMLSAGKHSALIAAVVEDFAAYYTPGAKVVYLGDTGAKWVVNEEAYLADLGIKVDPHGKMPDVLLHDVNRDWLVCVEAYQSVGPMDAKRVDELRNLFAGCRPGLVFVTAFPDKPTFRTAAVDIAWETDVWIRDAPTHLVHFNGERFLGPYDEIPLEEEEFD
ncbi:restriction endonuclease [Micromonospora sp. NBC_01699]|uniref:BsuBI/PstI family type II restriction endonuclease n=1 Tax=Micromonospora sp. NBC_01699 TaxID=2975984 RepID=UPI002E29384E|nr:BsuBI/PstI family type II restriction endonuclease [Micromonospora sp. NBC_01699]